MTTAKNRNKVVFALFLIAAVLTSTTAATLSTENTIPSKGTIVSAPQTITLYTSTNPTKPTTAILISGELNTTTNQAQKVTIEYTKNPNDWNMIATVDTDSNGRFQTAVSFPTSGIYTIRATCGNTVNTFTQTVTDRVVSQSNGDYSDIQTAINSLPQSGGVVYVKSGLYELNGKQITLRSNLTLLGDGIDQTIIRLYPVKHDFSPGLQACEDAITSASDGIIENVLLEQFTLIQNVVSVNHHGGINMRGADTNVTIRNVKITDVSGPAIGGGLNINLTIENCIIERSWTGIALASTTNGIIRNNTISDTKGDGIFPVSAASNLLIENNRLTNIGDTAVDITSPASAGVQGEKNVTVRNNIVVNGTMRVSNAADIQIIGNIIFNGKISIDGGQGTPANVKIIGNTIVSSYSVGIGFYGASNAIAKDNVITMTTPAAGVTQSGIAAAIWGTGVIQNNTILAAADYGIDFGNWALGNGNNITITGNLIQDYGKYGIYDDNKHTEPVYVKGNTFSSSLPNTLAVYIANSGNDWVIENNIYK